MASGRHTEGNKRGLSSVLLVVALVIAVAGLGWILVRPDGSNEGASCDGSASVVISVSPAMETPITQAIKDLGKDDCFPATVRAESASDVEKSFFNGGRPDLWVADSPARVDRLTELSINTTTVVPSLASTPVGLVGGPQSVQHESWIKAMNSEQVEYADPAVDGAVAMTLMSPSMESSQTGASQRDVDSAVVLAAQNYGQSATQGSGGVKPALADLKADSKKLVPLTEQEFIAQSSDGEFVDRTPPTGSAMLTFPLVKANGGAGETDVVSRALADWFKSSKGTKALADAGLRGPGGEPLDGKGFGDTEDLGAVPGEEFNNVLGRFVVLSVPSSLLAVFDVSGSMSREIDGQTRSDFAVKAALTALDAYPDQTRIGIWAFSINQGGKGQDWVELAPMARLSETTNGMKHRDYLAKQAKTMPDRLRGATGLYDTTLAAYEKALAEFDRNYYNAVVLFTDGENEDEGSISLDALVEKLKSLRDSNRPIRVIGIGITQDADMDALGKIAEATGGGAYLAENPADIMDVLADAILSR